MISAGIIILLYVLILLGVCLLFIKSKQIYTPGNSDTAFSIIICVRNESAYIQNCLKEIIAQQYPPEKIQVIVIDDASTDNTYALAEELLKKSGVNYLLLKNTQKKGKKESIHLAMESAIHEYIITRDGDTYNYSPYWLSSIAGALQTQKKELLICPVYIKTKRGLLHSFQSSEMMALQVFTFAAATAGYPFLCNGANLVFSKKLFYKTGAYKNHLHIASGDDVFLLEETLKLNKNLVGYLNCKETIVYTYPLKNVSALLHQKARWAGKITKQKSILNMLVALVIFSANAAFVSLFVSSFIYPQNRCFGLIFMGLKLLIDILLVFLAAGFAGARTSMIYVLLGSFVYPFYVLFMSIFGLLVKPKWKP